MMTINPSPETQGVSVSGTVVLRYGPMPASEMKVWTKALGDDAMMNTHAARLAGATMVVGTPEAIDDLVQRLEAHALDRVEGVVPRLHPEVKRWLAHLHPDAKRWLAIGEHGASSLALFQHLMGLVPGNAQSAVPHDIADFGRCHAMIAAVPSLEARMRALGDSLGPKWARIVKEWDALSDALIDERDGAAPRGHAQKLFDELIG